MNKSQYHLRRCSNVLAVWFTLDPLTTDSDFRFLSRLMRKEYYSQLFSFRQTTSPPKFRFLHLWSWLSYGVLTSITLVILHAMAPVNEAIESIGIVKFNGSFGATSIYRGAPSPEIDSTWDRISFNARPIRMTLEQLLRTGEKPSPSMVRYPDEHGGGYMATIEVIHQLHCVDMLRKASWGDHFYHHGTKHQSPEEFRTHLDHCIEILRQVTMCNGDVNMITHDWVEGSAQPRGDFDVPHQCRNFEKTLNWVDEHRVFVPKSKIVRLDDNVDLASPP
ncbi:hypothetical protein EDB19DRAFT_1707156 [Suillus lakei]|nr:hypothetical protein EDB19DRAFT_1707156 [Suillus lakei]